MVTFFVMYVLILAPSLCPKDSDTVYALHWVPSMVCPIYVIGILAYHR